MPVIDMIISGVNLMLVGMGFVFSFLIVLVFLMLGISRVAILLDKQKKAQDSESIPPPRSRTFHPSNAPGAELVAVISAAITRYRQTHH
jgi:oxaloacetate decarboxylase gamma subunit